MSGSGWASHLDMLLWSKGPPDVREWSGGPPGCLQVVGKTSRMSGSGRASHLDVLSWSEGPRMSGSGREALCYVRERS